MRAFVLVLAGSLLLCCDGSGSPQDFPCVWDTHPSSTPSVTWPDGPILGNGNIGVSIGGADGTLTLYVTVNGFWGTGNGTNSSVGPLDASSPSLGFPGCPAEDCAIPVGLTLAAITIENPVLTGWSAVLHIFNATAIVTLSDPTSPDTSLTVTAWVSATTQLVFLSLETSGESIQPVNVTAWANGNVLNLPVHVDCNGTSPACNPYVKKDASFRDNSVLFISGVLSGKWLSLSPGVVAAPPQVVQSTVPHPNWTGKTVPTLTTGISTVFKYPSGGGSSLFVFTAAASRDPGVYPNDPADAAAARLAAVTAGDVQTLAGEHVNWWSQYFSASAVNLGPTHNETEAYWWSAIYALGSASRPGQVVSDLWAPWRTTDYSAWRSNPTMDYNQQALYSGVYAANHVDVAGPYYDFVDQALASGGPSKESASLGCPDGVHFSVDLGPFGLKLGVYGEVQNWGIFSNAAYAAVNYAYHWEVVPQSSPSTLQWVNDHAWPFLSAVANFWTCRLVKTAVPTAPGGYEYWDLDDCTGDEGCSVPAPERGNPMWGVVYIRRVFSTLAGMAKASGKTFLPAWAEVSSHLPPIPTTLYRGEPVLAWYGTSNYTNWGGQANNLHALWPGELVSMSEVNATLFAAAQNSFNHTAWGQDNSFSWVFSSAVRAGVAPSVIFPRWYSSLHTQSRRNRMVAFAGLCSDSLGAVAFIHDMCVQSQEGFLRLFPGWPGDLSASFNTLRMKGATLVSSVYVGKPEWAGTIAGVTGGVANITVQCESDGPVSILSPWPAAPQSDITVSDGGAPVTISWSTVGGFMGGPMFTFPTTAGHAYIVTSLPSL